MTNQVMSVTKRILLSDYLHRDNKGGFCWVKPGEYKVRREFDDTRYLIETTDGLTLVDKSFTKEIY